MRKHLIALSLLALTGCPKSGEATSGAADLTPENYNPYKNVMPQKMKSEVEAAQKKEEDRDDKLLDKAK